MQLLRFRKRADNSIRLLIHLDETKTMEDGSPDPNYLFETIWPPKPDNVTATAYRDQIKQETKLLAQLELERLQHVDDEGTAIAGGGEGGSL